MKCQIKKMFVIAMLALITIGGITSCNSEKKLAKQAAKEYAAKLEQAKKDLNAILNDSTQWTA